jgi:hypothetical protein
MADVLLLVDASRTVEFFPPVRPASATLAFRSPGGTSLLTPAVTVDPMARTVSAAHATVPEQRFTAATGTGTPVVGRRYWWVSSDDGAHEAAVRLAEVDASVWTLTAPVPGATKVQANDLIKGARLTATITAAATATKGEGYRLEWTVTGADNIVYTYQQTAHVCRTLYEPPADAADAASFLARFNADHARGKSHGYYVDLGERATERVWRANRSAGRLINLLGNSGAFKAAGRVAIELELLDENIISPSAIDLNSHRTALDKRLVDEVEAAVSGQSYDADDDGATEITESVKTHSIPLRRY